MEIAESDFMKYTGGANFSLTNQENFKRIFEDELKKEIDRL